MAKKCAYPGCGKQGRTEIEAWGVNICKRHYEDYKNLSLMPLVTTSDWAKKLEAELSFRVVCGDKQAEKELRMVKSGIHPRLRTLIASDMVKTKHPEPNAWLKAVQKILDDLGLNIKVWPRVTKEDREKAQKTGKALPDEKYKRVKCEWCGEQIPRNGAAQFSHLRKHINRLVAKGLLTEEQAKEIRSIKVDNKIRKLLRKAISQK